MLGSAGPQGPGTGLLSTGPPNTILISLLTNGKMDKKNKTATVLIKLQTTAEKLTVKVPEERLNAIPSSIKGLNKKKNKNNQIKLSKRKFPLSTLVNNKTKFKYIKQQLALNL